MNPERDVSWNNVYQGIPGITYPIHKGNIDALHDTIYTRHDLEN